MKCSIFYLFKEAPPIKQSNPNRNENIDHAKPKPNEEEPLTPSMRLLLI